jgi:hypothetical protein
VALPSPVDQRLGDLRDFISAPERRASFMNDQQRWLKLCSAMDLLGDTQWAIEAFLDVHPDVVADETTGDHYLAAYGVLQAMFLQQDSLRHIHETLGVPFALDATLGHIRSIRNDSAGHPSDRKGGRFNFIVRHYLSRQGFQVRSLGTAEQDYREYWVDLPQLAVAQQASVAASLALLLRSIGPSPSELGHSGGV